MYTYIHDVADILADRNEEQRAKRLATRGYLLTGTKVPIQTPEVPYYNL
jgi:hypothetical protein